MWASRAKTRSQGVLLLACCALLLRQSVSLRELHRKHAAQLTAQTLSASERKARGLQEAIGDDYDDEDEELQSQSQLGGGISRLGIHGEGQGAVSHSLLESDSEVIALASAIRSGDAKATGRGAQKSRTLSDGGDEAAGDEENSEEGENSEEANPEEADAEEVAPDQEQVLKAAGPGQEQVLQAAGLIDVEEAGGAQAGEGASKEGEAGQEQAKALQEQDRNARPPWFSQRVLAADPLPKDMGGGRQKVSRRRRHHSTAEDTWLMCHRQFVKELAEWDKQGGWDVLFYGDSIVEEWRGTFLGAPWGPFHDVRKVWDEFFGRKDYRAHSMGIASDGVEQLLWRIQHGEVPSKDQHHPKVVVVQVGTNDITGECSTETADGLAVQMEKLLAEMHERLPNTHIVVMAILPKGEVWPNRCSEAIDEANSRISTLCEDSPHLHYIDLGSAFLSETLEGNRFEIKETLMPDSMHPSAVGMRIIATRLEPLVSQLVASSKLPQTSR